MSTELYIPNIVGKPGTEFYRHSETFRRRSAASKAKMLKYWSDPKNHERVDTKHAKPVAAYRMDGTFVGWWPSARKAAIALYPGEDHYYTERQVRAVRLPYTDKKSFRGYMFRDWNGDTSDIDPYKRKPKTMKRGYHRDNSNLKKPCEIYFPDGDFIRFDCIKDCAAAIERTPQSVSIAIRKGSRCHGYRIRLIKS